MPPIDVQTLMIAATLVLALLGTSLVLSWVQEPVERALLHWGASFLVAAPAVMMLAMRGHIADWISIGVANALVMAAHGLFLAGILVFERRFVRWSLVPAAVAVAIWGGACLVPGFFDLFIPRVMMVAGLSAVLVGAGAVVAWTRDADEPLPSRRIAAAFLALMAATQVARVVMAILHPVAARLAAINGSWMAPFAMVMLLQSVILAHLLLSLAKERAVIRHKREAEVDHLTGASTRRVFAERAQRRLAEAGDRGALLFFDLDRFKAINDTHGHAIGDRVLAAFAELVRRRIGVADLFGRWGGEEFVVLLGEADLMSAHRVAETIRRDFADLTFGHGAQPVRTTVSVGIGLPGLVEGDFEALIACADAGLYAAKSQGRDRVVSGSPRRRDAA